MKRYLCSASLMLAMASMTAFGLASPMAPGNQVPFKGSLEGTVTRSLPPPPISVNIDATGQATHLGRYTLQIPHLVTPPNAVGFYHFVAANGDTVEAEFTGLSTMVAPGFLYIVETATITGGTGRFAGASGSFVTERLYDIAAGTTRGTFEGTISHPNKH